MPAGSGHDTEALVADYEIHAGGSRIPPELHVVVSALDVDLDVEAVSMFSLLLHAGERDQERFVVIDSDQFKPGNEIKIKMGYGSTLDTMIVGEITSLSPEYGDSGAVEIRINGYDRLYRLGFGRKIRSFRNMKDSDIVSQIAQDWRLTPQVDATDVTHEYLLQNNQTDREFLTERARILRYEVRVEDKTLFFQKGKEDTSAVTVLTYGESLVEFFPLLSTLNQTSKVEVRGWSVKDKEAVSGEAAVGDAVSKMGGQKTGAKVADEVAGESKRIVTGENVPTKGQAEDTARAALNRAVTEFITGEGRCIGNPDVKAGKVVELKGLGDRFSGLYYVASSTHSIGPRGYYTFFTVRRTAI
jgi:phage protein D